MSRRPRVPSYRRHSSGQARVTIHGKDHLLGPYGSAESQEAYRRLVAEWLAGHAPPGPTEQARPGAVNEVILKYWKFARGYYGFDGRRGDEACLRDALRLLRSLYGRSPAREFGPRALKACRLRMIARGWSRAYVNAQVDRIRRLFRWAASEELLPAGVWEALRPVAGLRAGKSDARETPQVRPVAAEDIDATLPHLPPAVRAMVSFQRLTGCRPDEVCRVRPRDLDWSNPACWVYRPGSDRGRHGQHKTAHHGHDHVVLVGPRAQEVLRPYLQREGGAYCFSPAEGESARGVVRRQDRRTPLYPSHLRRLAARRTPRRQRAPGDRYDTHGYRRAIERACDRAFPLPGRLAPRLQEDGKKESRRAWWARLTAQEREEVRAWRRAHRWRPNRLRHSRATELRRYGLDVAKTILGHARVETTELYAEKELAAAMALIGRIG
jgi:integrase